MLLISLIHTILTSMVAIITSVGPTMATTQTMIMTGMEKITMVGTTPMALITSHCCPMKSSLLADMPNLTTEKDITTLKQPSTQRDSL